MTDTNCIKTIQRIIRCAGDDKRPTLAMIEAVNHVLPIMIECRDKLGWPIDRWITIIDYHARVTDARYFGDRYTINALRVCNQALEWKLGQRTEYMPV